MSVNLAAPPLSTPIVETKAEPGVVVGAMTKVFENWLRALTQRTQTAPYAVSTVALTSQGAAIAATDLIPSANGLYRVSYRFRVTQAATTSSSLTFSVTTTDGGVTVTQSSAAYTGNAVNAPQSGSFIVRCDSQAPLSYAMAFASVGATPMLYDLDVKVDSL